MVASLSRGMQQCFEQVGSLQSNWTKAGLASSLDLVELGQVPECSLVLHPP